MLKKSFLYASLFVAANATAAEQASVNAAMANTNAKANALTAPSDAANSKDAKREKGDKTLSGMSILGNQEAPKALVIVPWKSSQLGDRPGIAKNLDDSRQPVDKEVFMRELAYYEIRTNSK